MSTGSGTFFLSFPTATRQDRNNTERMRLLRYGMCCLPDGISLVHCMVDVEGQHSGSKVLLFFVQGWCSASARKRTVILSTAEPKGLLFLSREGKGVPEVYFLFRAGVVLRRENELSS